MQINIFPYQYEDQQTSCVGEFTINKVHHEYHTNFSYFQICFLKGNFLLRDSQQNKRIEENFAGIKAIIALKKDNLQMKAMQKIDSQNVVFTNQNNGEKNESTLMIINSDLENQLKNNFFLKVMLKQVIKKLVLGNEHYLLAT